MAYMLPVPLPSGKNGPGCRDRRRGFFRIRCLPIKRQYQRLLAEQIKAYYGPVLIIHGTKDRIVKPDYSRRAQQAYGNARLCLIDGGAHGFGKKHDAIAMEQLRRFAADL